MIDEKLAPFINNENRTDYRNYSLNHVRDLLVRLGNPHEQFRSIHIAGTNGKGSVAHMLHSIFMEAGCRVGLYTSPHLLAINERIRVGYAPIPDENLEDCVDRVLACIRGNEAPTFFDILTAAAFLHFRGQNVDIAIIETGLGGRLDSTNVLSPLCSIITSISLDHTSILGDTIEDIAHEKAGIIKPNTPVVNINAESPAYDVIMTTARRQKAPLYSYISEYRDSYPRRTETGLTFSYTLDSPCKVHFDTIEIPFSLPFQTINASCAITSSLIVRPHFPSINESSIRKGLAQTVVPGRFQRLSEDPLIYFDPAHNVEAVRAVLSSFVETAAVHPIAAVVTVMKDKDIAGIYSTIASHTDCIISYSIQDPRCFLPGRDSEPPIAEAIHADDEALFRRLDTLPKGTAVIFIGSFRLYRTALAYARRVAK